VGITPYMGLNFAIYESAKSFSESSFFNLNLENERLNSDVGSDSSGKKEGTLAAVLRKGLCGAVAGGTSKFIVYPLVSTGTNTFTVAFVLYFELLHLSRDSINYFSKIII
jgi:hypothetical protein